MNTLIKNIDEENWRFLKVEAAKQNITLGELFNRLVEEHKNRDEDMNASWQRIFSRPALLTKEEAKRMHKAIESFRREFSFEGQFMIVLDTNILIEFEAHNVELIKFLQNLTKKFPSRPYITSANYSEFLYGFIKESPKKQEKAIKLAKT